MSKLIITVILILVLAIIGVIVYAAFSGGVSGPANGAASAISMNKGVLVSYDAGDSWQFKNKIDKKKNISSMSVLDFKIDYVNKDIFYLAASKNGIYKTLDGGENWFKLNDFSKNLVLYSTINSIALIKNDSNIVFIGGIQNNQGVVLKSDDAGKNFQIKYSVPNKNYAVIGVAVDSVDSKIIYVAQDDGLLLQSIDAGNSWKIIHDFKMGIDKLIVDENDSRRIYSVLNNGNIFSSFDRGINWKMISLKQIKSVSVGPNINLLKLSFAKLSLGAIFDAYKYSNLKKTLFLDNSRPNILYSIFDGEINKSADFGNTWQKLNFVVQKDKVFISAVSPDPYNSAILYLTAGKYFYKSLDNGEHWAVIPIPVAGVASGIYVDPRDPRRIIITIK